MSKKENKKDCKVKTLAQLYLDEIREAPFLSHKEEMELAKRIEAGDEQARQQFIKSNLRLVVSIAKKYVRKSLSLTFLGLIQEGNFGVIHAVEKFNWRLGKRFSTYATYCIEGKIRKALFYDRRRNICAINLDAPYMQGSDGSMHGFVGDKKAVSPSSDADKNFLADVVENALVDLSSAAREIIKMTYGLSDGIAMDDEEIAKKLGLKIERVRQTRGKALRKLRYHKKLLRLKFNPAFGKEQKQKGMPGKIKA